MTAEEKRLRALLESALGALDAFTAGVHPFAPNTAEKVADEIREALERSEASKRGKSNRSRGHESEVMCVNWLKANGFPDATTTRNTGGEGGNQVGDVSFVPGICLEVKYEKVNRWPAWLQQASVEAGSTRTPVVVQRIKGKPDVARWPCVLSWVEWVEIVGEIPDVMTPTVSLTREADYAALLDRVPSAPFVCHVGNHGDLRRAVMRFGTFVEAVRLDQ